MTNMTDNPLWTERYRPSRVADVVAPADIKRTVSDMIESGEVPNLLLSGPPGVGKTTVALAMMEELGYEVYVINGSLKGNIDTLRNEIMDFASTVSFSGARKVVLIDEADYLNPQSTQPALRNFMEQFSGNCGFILTCNYRSRIIEPLQSRCAIIDFSVKKSDKPELMTQFFTRVKDILATEGVEFDPQVVGTIINKHFPDWRRVLNELQRHSVGGKIDAGALSRVATSDDNFGKLLGMMRRKDYTEVRRWIAENSDVESSHIFRTFYDSASAVVTPDSIPQLVVTIAEYQYKSAHVADQEVNLAAFLATVMATVTFRE